MTPESTIMVGRVISDGYPVSDANITLYNNGDTLYTKTDVNGVFTIEIK